MFPQTFTSVLYNFIFLTSFVNCYIYFAAHLDDLENVAKKLAPDGRPVERAKPIARFPHQDKPEDELRVDYYEEVNPPKDYRDAESPEGEDSTEGDQGRKVLRGRDTNIDELAKKIKDRVLKELADEFIRLKKQRKKNRQSKQRNEKATTNHRDVEFERQKELVKATTPIASVVKREKYLRPVEVGQVMPTKNILIEQSLNTKTKNQIEEITDRLPITVQSDEFEIEKIDLGQMSNDSYEYYIVPPKDEIVFEAVDEPTTPAMVRYKIQANTDAEAPMTTKFRPPIPQPNYAAEGVLAPIMSNKKFEGDGETYIMYDVEGEEEPIQTQRTRKTTHGMTRKLIRMTRSRYSMTSPNYYASLPTIAERYDFNEPIPIRDRVRSI